MKKYAFVLFAIFNMNFAYSATNTEDVYLLAQTKNVTELQNIKNIDVVNKNGDTALCSAIKDGNIDAYNLLKNAGANTEHKCVKKIPTEQYEHFMTKVASVNKPWSFLGLGKWAWAGIGAGVVGGVAVAGMGGGGGGSGGSSGTIDNTQNNNTLNCGANAYFDGTQCVCDTGYQNWTYNNGCILDSENYIEQNGQAYSKLNCVHGIQNTSMCSCFGGWTGDLCDTPVTCEGYVSSCSFGYNITSTCQSGDNTLVQCTFDSENYIEQNGQAYLKLDCSVGIQIGNACVNDSEIIIDNVESTSTAAVYGMYNGVYNGYNNITNEDSGIINIKNTYNPYGMRTSGSNIVALNNGKIYIDNTSLSYSINADAYGISVYYGASAINADTGEIKISNGGTNMRRAVGMFAYDATLTNDGIISVENTGGTLIAGMAISSYTNSDDMTAVNNGTIILKNIVGSSSSHSKGIVGYDYNFRDSYITNNGAIFIENAYYAEGIYGINAVITNNDTITIENVSHAEGIWGSDAVITNNGTITIENGGHATGISAHDSIVNNVGTITITNSDNFDSYGIAAYGPSTIVRNTGTISVNGTSCTGNACGNNDRFIYLVNGATFVNSGLMSAPKMNLTSMNGKVVAKSGSSFVVDNEMSGDLHIDSDVVTNGNQTTYIAENMIDAGDTSALNLISDSAMFDASLVGNDVVMQMKDFNSLTDNASLAAFLKHNYENSNGGDLFAALKSLDNMSAFNGALMGLSGLDSFTQFAHEDLSALREISLSMNNKLFENSDRDNFDISDSMGYFSFSDNHNSGSGQYGISSSRLSDNWKLGYGMAMANIYTNDGDGFSRQNQMWMFYMPATYTNDDIELVITSQAGFTHGQYNRRGFNNHNYEGYIEKQIVGLMNDLRYPIIFGNWTLAPDMAFNAIMYKQSGHEDEREFSLIIPNDTMVSVETGLGLYSKYEKTFQNGGRLKLTSGIMGYREYGDTYNIKLGMRGMDGTFDLYNNDYKYRAALNMGIDYAVGNFHMYGNTQYFMDNANYMNFKGGISYRF